MTDQDQTGAVEEETPDTEAEGVEEEEAADSAYGDSDE